MSFIVAQYSFIAGLLLTVLNKHHRSYTLDEHELSLNYLPLFHAIRLNLYQYSTCRSVYSVGCGLGGKLGAWMHDKPDDPNGDPTFPDIEGKTGVDFSGRCPLCSPGE